MYVCMYVCIYVGHMKLIDAAIAYYKQHFHLFRSNYPKNHPCHAADPLVGYTPVIPVLFEICGSPVDKQPLSEDDIRKRLMQFEYHNIQSHMNSNSNNYMYNMNNSNGTSNTTTSSTSSSSIFPSIISNHIQNIHVTITSNTLFIEKSHIFKQCIFIIGVDTMIRLFNSKYYDDSILKMMISLHDIIYTNKCMFIVGGRMHNNTFQTMHDVWSDIDKRVCSGDASNNTNNTNNTIPLYIRNAFHGLSESEYRLDISSTELRNI